MRRSRREPAAVEVAVVMPGPGGGFTHRRMGCSGNNLLGALPFLFDPDPEALARGGDPSAPRWVEDKHFETLQEALASAERQHPPADPYKWKGASRFRQTLPPEHELGPEAGDVGRLPVVAGWAAFAVAVYAGYRLNLSVGLDTPERAGSTADSVFTTVAILVSNGLGLVVYAGVSELLRRRNLAKERNR